MRPAITHTAFALIAATTAIAAPAAHAQQRRGVVKVNISEGAVRVAVNGQDVGSLTGFGKTADISRHLRPGENTVKVTWAGRVNGYVHVGTAQPGEGFRRVSTLQLYPQITATPGSKTQTFTLNNSGTGANGGSRRPAPGSVDNQVCLGISTNAPLSVFLNGRKVGQYNNGYLLLDVGDFLKPGKNTLTARWVGNKTLGQVAVRYARTKNAFKNVTVLSVHGSSPKSLTFQRPY